MSDRSPVPTAPPAPDRPIRVGVVGAGYFGALHARNLAAQEGARLIAVVDVDLARAREIAAAHGAEAFDDPAALEGRVDAVCLAAPTSLHGELGCRLMSAGLDVLIEKPIAATREEAEQLLSLARRERRVLQVGHLERFNPAFQEALRLAGRPVLVEAERLGPFRHRALDVSIILDLMIHDIDLVTALLGGDVASIEAEGSPILSGTEDLATARIVFASGAVARLTASRISPNVRRVLRIYWAEGYVSVDLAGTALSLTRVDPARLDEAGYPSLVTEDRTLAAGNNIAAEQQAFLRSVRTREPPPITGEDGLRALDLALRIEEAARAWRRRVGPGG